MARLQLFICYSSLDEGRQVFGVAVAAVVFDDESLEVGTRTSELVDWTATGRSARVDERGRTAMARSQVTRELVVGHAIITRGTDVEVNIVHGSYLIMLIEQSKQLCQQLFVNIIIYLFQSIVDKSIIYYLKIKRT